MPHPLRLQSRLTPKMAVLALILAGRAAQAQDEEAFEDEFKLLQEEEVVYAAAKHKQDISDSPAAVVVITREQIDNSPCNTFSCLLRQLPETEVALLSPLFTSVGTRSFGPDIEDRVLVLVDGRVVNNDLAGQPFWDTMPIHVADVERIEMVRGPASALYGANAYMALISITTRRVNASGAKVHLSGAAPGALDLYGRVEQKWGDWGLHLSLSRETGGDWLLRGVEQRQVHRARLRLDRQSDASDTQLEIGYSDPSGSVYTNVAMVHFGNSRFAYLLGSHRRQSWDARLSLTLYQADLVIDMPLFYGGLKLGDMPKVYQFTEPVLSAEWQGNVSPWRDNLLIGGLSYRFNSFLSPDNQPDKIFEHNLGVFVHDEQKLWEQLLLTLGVRLDYNTITPLSVSPRATAVWRLGQHNVRLSLGQSFRKPSIFNTSIHVKGVKGIAGIDQFFLRGFGNNQLDNESVKTVELGYRGRFQDGRLTMDGDVFYSQYRDTIGFVYSIKSNSLGMPDLNSSSMGFANNGQANALGGSISITWRWLENLRLYGNYSYQYRFQSSKVSDRPEGKKGAHLPWIPDHLFNLGGDYQSSAGLRLGLNFHFESSRKTESSKNGAFGDVEVVPTSAVAYTSLSVSWRVITSAGWLEAGFKAFNVWENTFKDCPQFYRADGTYTGCQTVGQQIWLFLDASM